MGWRRLLLALVIALCPSRGDAHDPSAWGGLFRSRDSGATWFPANPGRYVSGAIALAISPVDPSHLLLATDSGLLRSRNGGRDWEIEAPDVLIGPIFAAAFDADGRRALVSTAMAIVRREGDRWRAMPAPSGAAPARALAAGSAAGRVYLAGWSGFYRSDDWGTSWASISDGLPDEPVSALVVASGHLEVLYAIVGEQLWAGFDGARSWHPRDAGLPSGRVDALALDARDPTQLWVVGAGHLFRSADYGAHWQPVGRSLPEGNTTARGIAVSGPAIVLTTDRGVYHSADGGERWMLLSENLPAHLEAGPLVRDTADPATLYAGFALTPYAELWRQAAEGGTALGRLSLSGLAGGVAFLALLTLGAAVTLRKLARAYYRAPLGASPSSRAARAPRSEDVSQ